MLVVALVCLFPGCKEGSQAVMWTVTWSRVTPYVAAGGYNNQVLIFGTETFRLQKVMPIGRGAADGLASYGAIAGRSCRGTGLAHYQFKGLLIQTASRYKRRNQSDCLESQRHCASLSKL